MLKHINAKIKKNTITLSEFKFIDNLHPEHHIAYFELSQRTLVQ